MERIYRKQHKIKGTEITVSPATKKPKRSCWYGRYNAAKERKMRNGGKRQSNE